MVDEIIKELWRIKDGMATEHDYDANVQHPAIDAKWTEVARRRLLELRFGKVNPIPGDEVFSEVFKRFAR